MDELIDGISEFLPGFTHNSVFNPWDQSELGSDDSSIIDYSDGADLWREQTTPFTCAVVAQQMILERFGIEISEAQLVYDSVTNGWLTDNGTDMQDVGALLEYYGVPVHQGVGGDIESLVYELAKGHKVIVGVDSGELWGQDFFMEDWLNPYGADHAIMVNGIDTSDPNNILVIVNDPGMLDGAGVAYPLKDFMDAWNDSGQFYMSTSIAPPGLEDMPVLGNNFNEDAAWYFDQNFWGGVLKGILTGVTTGEIAYQWSGDEGSADTAAFISGGVATFAHVVDYFDIDMLDNTFYSI